jgi:prepilin-type N-terminal cleavage/methylation domain-containing protein
MIHMNTPRSTLIWGDLSKSDRHRHGFSLIELLIVITVLGLLLSLALPALRAARLSASAQACLLNSRACTMAMLQYASDHHEIMPYRATNQTFLNAYTADGLGMDYSSHTIWWPSILRQYLDSSPVPKPSLCPAAYSYWQASGGRVGGSEPFASYNLSYGLFSRPELWDSKAADASERWLRPVAITEVSFPDRKTMLVEAYAFHLRGTRQPDLVADNLLMLERPPGSTKLRPITFCDGSARNLNRAPLSEPYSGPVGPGFWFHFAGIMTEQGARGLDLK